MSSSEIRSSREKKLKMLSIDGWRAGIRFSSCHLIPHHKKCSRLHGHTYVLHLKIKGFADESGFLMDFSDIKRTLQDIASSLDHRVLLPGRNPHINVAEENDSVKVQYQDKYYQFPREDVVILDLVTLTAEILSDYILREFVEKAPIPDSIVKISAGIDEGPGQGAWSSLELKQMN